MVKNPLGPAQIMSEKRTACHLCDDNVCADMRGIIIIHSIVFASRPSKEHLLTSGRTMLVPANLPADPLENMCFPVRCMWKFLEDGMWAVMAWLQILAKKTEEAGKLVSVEDSFL